MTSHKRREPLAGGSTAQSEYDTAKRSANRAGTQAGKFLVYIRGCLGDRERLFGRYLLAEAAAAEVKKLRRWDFDAVQRIEVEPTLNALLLRRGRA